MRRTVKIAIAGGIVFLILLPFIGLGIGQTRRLEEYGETPRIGVRYSEAPGEGDCQQVVAVTPRAYYNWLGQTWQASHIDWSDIRVESEANDGWKLHPHGMDGPIKVGNKICGVSKELRWRWVFVPDMKTVVLNPT